MNDMYAPGDPNPAVMDQKLPEYAKLTILIERSSGTDRVVIDKVTLDSVNIVEQIKEADEETNLVIRQRGFQANETVEMGLQFTVHKSPSGTLYSLEQNVVPPRYLVVEDLALSCVVIVDLQPNSEGVPQNPKVHLAAQLQDKKKFQQICYLLNKEWASDELPELAE